jgi:SAM-dependent methyltransferase
MMVNADRATVEGFGYEWSKFDQSEVSPAELDRIFADYFAVFPWERLPKDAVGFDLGCGSGRWAMRVAPRVGKLYCIDASADALAVAKRNAGPKGNCEFVHASVDEIPLQPGSMDFGYSLGVLHHVPNTLAGLKACVRLLKSGAPFLLYLYYALENRAPWFRALWKASDGVRRLVSRQPLWARKMICEGIAAGVYWPLSRTAKVAEKAGVPVAGLPLSAYRDKGYRTLRTDAFDRFATRLEQRFTRQQIERMMLEAGLERIRFHEGAPYWCVVGTRS